jgi:large subunit ribosomal protein L31
MKPKIHPDWVEAKVTCACGETFTSYSTKKVLKVEICSKCHPLFTGQQKIVDTEGRVEKFISKYKKKAEPAKATTTTQKETPASPKEATKEPVAKGKKKAAGVK